MSTIVLTHAQTRERARPIPQFITPAHALRKMPSDLPKDSFGREIAILVHEHPEIADQFPLDDLNVLPVEAKAEMLASVKAALGIRPLRRRHLGYVGP